MNDLERYLEFARPHYVGKHMGHDIRHIEGVVSRLHELSEGLAPPPVRHKLYFLACFHGLGRKIPDHRCIRAERQNFDPAGHYARPDVTRLIVNRRRQSTVSIVGEAEGESARAGKGRVQGARSTGQHGR